MYASVSEEASLNLELPNVGASVILKVNSTYSRLDMYTVKMLQ